jgi:hypothetical protein
MIKENSQTFPNNTLKILSCCWEATASPTTTEFQWLTYISYTLEFGRWSNMGSKKDCLSLISTNPISICSSHMNTKIVLDIGKLVSNMLYSCSS